MDIVTLAALTDTAATPARALATIATRRNDDVTNAYLLAHPNTPDAALAGRQVTSSSTLWRALRSPALTDITAARLLAATDDDALLHAAGVTWNTCTDTRPVHALAGRLQRLGAAAAWTLLDHPAVNADTQVAALYLAARDVGIACRYMDQAGTERGRLTLASARRPQHLRPLAALVRRNGHNQAQLAATPPQLSPTKRTPWPSRHRHPGTHC